jgi:hypothetical protein
MRYRLVAAIGILALVAVACGDDEPARDTTGAITETGDASVFALQVGDCFNDEASAGDVVSEVPVTPCSEPHDNEIYFEYSMTEASFPGDDQVLEISAQRCLEEFEGFVGIDYLDSELDLFPITPTRQSWAEGDRVVYCAVYALDLSKLEGSMAGSRR